MPQGGSGDRQRREDRPAYAGKLVASLKPGDLLVVTRLDRLARSTIDLLTLLKAVGDTRLASFLLGSNGPIPPPPLVG